MCVSTRRHGARATLSKVTALFLFVLDHGDSIIEDVNVWTGLWDEPEEGSWSDVNTGQVRAKDEYQPWFPGEPNGDRGENCAIIWSIRNAWNDQSCLDYQCGFCELEVIPRLQLRGN